MVSEAVDVQTFLAQHPPFNQLTEKQLEFAGNNIYVAFSKSGSELPSAPVDNVDYRAGMFIVRSGSLEIRDEKNMLVDRLSSGDYLVLDTLRQDQDKSYRIIVLEDCLYYELTEQALQTLAAGNSDMADICEKDKTLKVHEHPDIANPDLHRHADLLTKDAYLTQRVKDTMSKDIVSVAPETTIRQAAQIMKQRRISSLLIMDNSKLAGIITDRDFRTRVLAEGVADNELLQGIVGL